jgi:hypothetical protein
VFAFAISFSFNPNESKLIVMINYDYYKCIPIPDYTLTNRPRRRAKTRSARQLERLLAFARDGDNSMDRLARNLDDLCRLVQALTGRGVRIEFGKESLTLTGGETHRWQT